MKLHANFMAAMAAMAFIATPASAQKNGPDTIEALIAKETDPDEIKALREIQEMNRKADKANAEKRTREKQEAEAAKKVANDAKEKMCGKYRYAIIGQPITEVKNIATCKDWGILYDTRTTISANRTTTFHHYQGATVMFVNGKISSYTEKN